jgi:hypothetical protein
MALTIPQRQAQFDIVESKAFIKWFDQAPGEVSDHAPIELLGSKPTRRAWSSIHGSYREVESNPIYYDEERTKAITIFLIVERNKRPTGKRLLVKSWLQRATRNGVEQITGSDIRLAQFWADAELLAKENNYCEEFDRLAEMLGGPKTCS